PAIACFADGAKCAGCPAALSRRPRVERVASASVLQVCGRNRKDTSRAGVQPGSFGARAHRTAWLGSESIARDARGIAGAVVQPALAVRPGYDGPLIDIRPLPDGRG